MILAHVVLERSISAVMGVRSEYDELLFYVTFMRQFPNVMAPYCVALEKSVGAMLFCHRQGDCADEAAYLLIKYPHGHWEFPRGHVEDGESELETAYREIQEETNIVESQLVVLEGFRETFSFGYRARGGERVSRIKQNRCLFIRKRAVFFLAEVISDPDSILLSDEHTDHVWLPYAAAQQKLTHGNARRILKKAHKHLLSLHG